MDINSNNLKQKSMIPGQSIGGMIGISLCALVATVPFLWREASLDGAAFYKYLAVESVAIAAAIFVLFFYVKRYERCELKIPVIIWPVLGFHLMAAVSMLWAVDAGASLVQLVQMFGLFILFLLTVYTTCLRPVQFTVLIVRVAVAAAVILSFIGLLQNFGYLEDLYYQIAAPAATMVNKNVLAQYIGTTLFPSLLMVFWAKGRLEITLSAFSFAVLLAMIMVTFTRGAWFGGLVSLIFLLGFLKFHPHLKLIWSDENSMRYKYVAVVMAVLLALFVMLLPSPVNKGSLQSKFLDAIDQPEQGASALRLALYANSWELFMDHPFGIGLGNWRNIYPEYHNAVQATPGFGLDMQPRKLHNDPFQFFVEMGLLGGLSFVAILALLIWTVWRMISLESYSREQRLILLSLFLSLMGVGVHSLFSFPFESPASAMQIWVWLGVVAGLSLASGSLKEHDSLLVRTFSLKRMHMLVLFALMLLMLALLAVYEYAHFKGSELEKESYILFKTEKCVESLDLIDASVKEFPYAYTATMRQSMYHQVCDPDRQNVLDISLELLKREPYYPNLLVYIVPSALENGRLDVVADVAERLVRVFPGLPFGYHWQAMIAGGKGDYEKAIELFVQALEKDADFQPSKEMLNQMRSLQPAAGS